MKKRTGRSKTTDAGKQYCLYTYQDTSTYFAQIAEGLEPLAQDELVKLGAAKIKPGFRGMDLHFDYTTGSPHHQYRHTG